MLYFSSPSHHLLIAIPSLSVSSNTRTLLSPPLPTSPSKSIAMSFLIQLPTIASQTTPNLTLTTTLDPLPLQAFVRLKDMGYIDLVARIEAERKQPGHDDHVLVATVLAYQGKFQEAAKLFCKVNLRLRQPRPAPASRAPHSTPTAHIPAAHSPHPSLRRTASSEL